MEKAQTIYQQLGGNHFAAMTGARNLVAHDDGLSFKLPSTPHYTRQGINYVRIRLNGLDLYDVEYGRIWGLKYKKIRTENDLYADMIEESFRQATGLETRMPRVEGITC
jgi:hypothetical protein